MYQTKRYGFTLIEIMISLSIIGLLIGAGAVAYPSLNKDSRNKKRELDINKVRSALENYRSEDPQSSYPITITALNGTYLNPTPFDPLTHRAYALNYRATSCSSPTICSSYFFYIPLEPTGQQYLIGNPYGTELVNTVPASPTTPPNLPTAPIGCNLFFKVPGPINGSVYDKSTSGNTVRFYWQVCDDPAANFYLLSVSTGATQVVNVPGIPKSTPQSGSISTASWNAGTYRMTIRACANSICTQPGPVTTAMFTVQN